jgi:hypothetical protein
VKTAFTDREETDFKLLYPHPEEIVVRVENTKVKLMHKVDT